MKRTVLLLGSGGREHALAWKLSQSPGLGKLLCAPGSDAIAALAECQALDIHDAQAVSAFAKKSAVSLVVVGPEAPLAAGVADALRAAGVPVFGPGKDAAQLESSKAFAKRFMTRHKLPTAGYEVFTEAWRARSAVEAMRLPLVVKADGLAAGKGVVVCKDTNQALGTITDFMEKKTLGASGETVVVERCLEGPELSALALLDGKSIRLLPFCRDHKRLKDGDEGPNTGGMGVFAPVAVNAETERRIREIFDKVLAGLAADRLDYRGVLYAGLMLTPSGPQLLEFNVRFGDPETQALMPLIDGDLLELMLACAEGKLEGQSFKIKPGASVTVTLASEGYPGTPLTGRKIEGLDSLKTTEDLMVFHAGTAKGWLTKGGRVLNVTARGADLEQARTKAYAAVAKLRFDGMQYRKDIGGVLAKAS